MPSWTFTGSPTHDALLSHARAQLPPDFASSERPAEDLHALAAMFQLGEAAVADWMRMIRLSYADGKWLRQHGADRGYRPQENETEDAQRERYRTPPAAVTIPALLAALNAILTAAGIAGTVKLLEVPEPSGAFVGTSTSAIRAYVSRGERIWRTGRGHLVLVVPAAADPALGPTEAGAVASMLEALRVKRAAGITYHYEVET